MCKQTKQRYSGCYCYTLLHEICGPHIEHTRLQIDNEPCPGLMFMTTQSMTRRCRSNMECIERVDTFYTFENNGARMFERDRKRKLELKEWEEEEKREKEERERKMAEREERDRQYWEEKPKKKAKKEEVEERAEVNMNELDPWKGMIEVTDKDVNI